MALQHFYSRVPSRMAMYNKQNGFDTFALSEGIDKEFIDLNLEPILEIKNTEAELTKIRSNSLYPIYCHFLSKDKRLIESSISFFNKDYSNERTSYLVHSLIFSDEEIKKLHYINNISTITTSNFKDNFIGFDFESLKSKAIKNYPELDFVNDNINFDYLEFVKGIDQNLFNIYLFALIMIIFKQTKMVNIVPKEDSGDDFGLKFFNMTMQIVPYNLRKYVSFISRVNDPTKFKNFNLRIISNEIKKAGNLGGITIDFNKNDYYGVKQKDLKSLTFYSDFLYSLMFNEEGRNELFNYFEYVIEHNPNYKETDFKEFINLLYFFMATSGLCDLSLVVENDADLIELFNIYEKERDGIDKKYRINLFNMLKRYPENYALMPKQIFSKISKSYSSDIDEVKTIYLNLCLDYIHQDSMRSHIFNFLKDIYENENDVNKDSIIDNLCGVYNGEFLQNDILIFFNDIFKNASLKSRNNILNTIFLSARTKVIQDKILVFFKANYDNLNLKEKELFYFNVSLYLEEGDYIAHELIILSDSNIVNEDAKLIEHYKKYLCRLLLDEQRNKFDSLLKLVASTNGFTFETIAYAIFTKWIRRKFSNKFIVYSLNGELIDITKKMIQLIDIASDIMDDVIYAKITNSITNFVNSIKISINVDDIYVSKDFINNYFINKKDEYSLKFIEFFNNLINLLFECSLDNVFNSKEKNQIEKYIESTKNIYSVKSSSNYQYLINYTELKDGINKNDYSVIFNKLDILQKSDIYSKKISSYILLDLLFDEEINLDMVLSIKYAIILSLSNFLRYGKIKISIVYDKLIADLNKLFDNQDLQQYECIIARNLAIISSRYCDILNNDNSKEDILNYDNGLSVITNDIFVKYGKGQLDIVLKDVNPCKDITDDIKYKMKGVKSMAGIFAKVYKI